MLEAYPVSGIFSSWWYVVFSRRVGTSCYVRVAKDRFQEKRED
jgi:hypothetical protein